MDHSKWGNGVDLLLFTFLCIAVALAPILYGATDPIIVLNYEFAAFAALGVWAFKLCLSGKSPRWHALFIPAGVFAFYVWFQIIPVLTMIEGGLDYSPVVGEIARYSISLDPAATKAALLKFLSICIYSFLTLNLVTTERRLTVLVNLIIIIGFIIGLQAIIQDLTWNGKLYWFREVNPRSQAFGPFVNKDHAAGYLELPFGLGFGLLFCNRIAVDRRLLFGLFTLVTGVAILVSTSRGGFVSLIGAVVVILLIRKFDWAKPHQSKGVTAGITRMLPGKFALIAVLLLGGLLGSAFWVNSEALGYSIQTLGQQETYRDLAGRREIWRTTIDIIEQALVTGSGFGAYGISFPRYTVMRGDATTAYAHNDYLQLLADTGLIGSVIVLSGLVFYLFSCFRKFNFSPDSTYSSSVQLGCLGGIVAILIHSFFDFNLQVYGTALTFAVLMSLYCSIEQLYHSSRQKFEISVG